MAHETDPLAIRTSLPNEQHRAQKFNKLPFHRGHATVSCHRPWSRSRNVPSGSETCMYIICGGDLLLRQGKDKDSINEGLDGNKQNDDSLQLTPFVNEPAPPPSLTIVIIIRRCLSLFALQLHSEHRERGHKLRPLRSSPVCGSGACLFWLATGPVTIDCPTGLPQHCSDSNGQFANWTDHGFRVAIVDSSISTCSSNTDSADNGFESCKWKILLLIYLYRCL
jgi:hypothetical protein